MYLLYYATHLSLSVLGRTQKGGGILFGRKHYVWSRESRADESGPSAVASVYRIYKKGWILQ